MCTQRILIAGSAMLALQVGGHIAMLSVYASDESRLCQGVADMYELPQQANFIASETAASIASLAFLGERREGEMRVQCLALDAFQGLLIKWCPRHLRQADASSCRGPYYLAAADLSAFARGECVLNKGLSEKGSLQLNHSHVRFPDVVESGCFASPHFSERLLKAASTGAGSANEEELVIDTSVVIPFENMSVSAAFLATAVGSYVLAVICHFYILPDRWVGGNHRPCCGRGRSSQ
eukprot:TRINITY_DN93471_c0_g1_i1.p1 TRINITY_DN93471_c0_g1~~TRINITY_DN93471_c0_g1_i1.p1  ORF type:complete len:255 (+),score=24.93 TRINITY_DN93471_c0_g1_i1:56-766(+)